MAFQTYEDLEIYRLSHDLAIEVHKVSLGLPKFELYEEGSQLRRSAKAIPANIVEGFGRRHYKNEFIRFLTFALASCDETKEHLKILYETASFNDTDNFDSFILRYEELGRKSIIKPLQGFRGQRGEAPLSLKRWNLAIDHNPGSGILHPAS